MTDSIQEQYENSPLSGSNAQVVEGYYEAFLKDPGSVPD